MFPNYNQWLSQAWGWSDELVGSLSAASNIVVGSNPPYTANDLIAFYPKFGGTPLVLKGDIASGSNSISNIPNTGGAAVGQLVAGSGIPKGATITAVADTTLTLSVPATAVATQADVSVFNAMLVPLPVINAYITLASACLVQPRWCDMWPLAMGLYAAHFLTLWLRSDGSPQTTPGQAAMAGLARGITISKTAGSVSQSIQPIQGLEDWGSWTQTEYGVQLIGFFRAIGSGPMLVW